MKIKCMDCGQSVSSVEIPEGTIIRAWIQCPECIASERGQDSDDIAGMITGLQTEAPAHQEGE